MKFRFYKKSYRYYFGLKNMPFYLEMLHVYHPSPPTFEFLVESHGTLSPCNIPLSIAPHSRSLTQTNTVLRISLAAVNRSTWGIHLIATFMGSRKWVATEPTGATQLMHCRMRDHLCWWRPRGDTFSERLLLVAPDSVAFGTWSNFDVFFFQSGNQSQAVSTSLFPGHVCFSV